MSSKHCPSWHEKRCREIVTPLFYSSNFCITALPRNCRANCALLYHNMCELMPKRKRLRIGKFGSEDNYRKRKLCNAEAPYPIPLEVRTSKGENAQETSILFRMRFGMTARCAMVKNPACCSIGNCIASRAEAANFSTSLSIVANRLLGNSGTEHSPISEYRSRAFSRCVSAQICASNKSEVPEWQCL